MVKRLFQHIGGEHVGILLGFITLGIALHKDYGTWISLAFAIVGLILALSAAHNAYIAKSTALVDKYDERFFRNMKHERRSAALFLLGENSTSDELEDVLDFFETPIAKKVEECSIDAEQVYETFYHWIRLYYQASETFIGDYRKDEPAAYTSLAGLYAETSKFEVNQIGTGKNLRLAPERLTEYLRQEANLKTEPSDWGKVFHQKKSGH